jgi:ribonuclease HI
MVCYAVIGGSPSGVFDTWDECKKACRGCKGAIFKKFGARERAAQFIERCNLDGFDVDYYVYTDGACLGNGRSGARAGLGVYFGEGDVRNVSEVVVGKQTNNVAEVSAIIKAYELIKNDIDAGKHVVIVTDSIYALRAVLVNEEKTNKPNKELVDLLYKLYDGLDNVKFMYIEAHTGRMDVHSIGNDKADMLASSKLI